MKSGTGEVLEFTHVASAGEARRFWRIECQEGGLE
jgi:hypothetical protein